LENGGHGRPSTAAPLYAAVIAPLENPEAWRRDILYLELNRVCGMQTMRAEA